MSEAWIIAFVLAGAGLWALGGTGLKWARRIAWPIVALLFVSSSSGIFLGGLVGAVLALTCSFPYGDRTPWPLKVGVFLLLPAPALALNPGAWIAVVIGGFLISALAFATRKWNFVSHKLFELGAGTIQASVIVIACLMK